MKFQEFTKDDYEYLVDKCMLNKEMAQILKMRIQGESITKISLEMNMSERTIGNKIKELKKKIMKVL